MSARKKNSGGKGTPLNGTHSDVVEHVDASHGATTIQLPVRAVRRLGMDFDVAGRLQELPDTTAINPGVADIQLAAVARLGHRDQFARPYDWENLIPLLKQREELLWIVAKREGGYRLFLGLKANDDVLSERQTVLQRRKHFEVICDCFARRAFPESRLTLLPDDEASGFLNDVAEGMAADMTCITGVPSPKRLEREQMSQERDEERRPFVGLNDVLESLTEERDFTLVFTLARASHRDVQKVFEECASVRTELSPFLKQEINASRTVSTDTHTDVSVGESESATIQRSPDALRKTLNFLVGVDATPDGSFGAHPQASVQRSTNRGASSGWSDGVQDTRGVGATISNASLEFLDKTLALTMEHLQKASGTGGFFGSVLIYAVTREASSRIARVICATLSGVHSHIRPMTALPFVGPQAGFQLTYNVPVHEYLDCVGAEIQILNCDQAGTLLLVPDAELPGCSLKRSVFYGRPQLQHKTGGTQIGEIAFYGRTLSQPGESADDKASLRLSSQDLCSHVLIVGTTGSGKTERAVHILNNVPRDEFQIVVLETAKKTYRNKLWRGEDPLIYTMGDSTRRPLRLNPFFFEPGTSLKRHISVLADAVAELLPVENLIGPKLRQAVEQCYEHCGWNVETGTFCGVGKPSYPDMILFNHYVDRVCHSLRDYGPEVRANYRGALLNRAAIFVDAVYQDLFASDGNRCFEELFPCDTIIEMEEMPPSELNMPAFVMSIILERVRAYLSRPSQPEGGKPKKAVLLVIEEAHNILHRRYEQPASEQEAGRGKRLIEQVVRLLQEGRGLGLGVMVVDQSAQYLADAVIANTNTKIVHRQEDGHEVEVIGESLGLPDRDWEDMRKLEDGECIVKTKAAPRPVKLSPIPLSRLQAPRAWAPFAEASNTPDYRKADALLQRALHPHVGESHIALIDRFAQSLFADCDLMRFVVGRSLITSGRQEWLGMVSRIREMRDVHLAIHTVAVVPQERDAFVRMLAEWCSIPCHGGAGARANVVPSGSEWIKEVMIREAISFVERTAWERCGADQRAEYHSEWSRRVASALTIEVRRRSGEPDACGLGLEWLKLTDRYWSHFRPLLLHEYARATGEIVGVLAKGWGVGEATPQGFLA
jgi:hypothetical protein